MARYDHLPIYNTAFSVLKELYIRVPKFGKQYKYTLGSRLLDAGQEIVLLIIQANNDRTGRLPILESLRRKCEEITILTRIGSEKRGIQYSHAAIHGRLLRSCHLQQMTDQDLITIRHEAQSTHELTKTILDKGAEGDLETHRDLCIEKKNAVNTVIDDCENQKEELRRQKRLLDDRIADVNKLQREYKCYKEDLDLDAKRCNQSFWDLRKGRKMQDSYPSQQ